MKKVKASRCRRIIAALTIRENEEMEAVLAQMKKMGWREATISDAARNAFKFFYEQYVQNPDSEAIKNYKWRK